MNNFLKTKELIKENFLYKLLNIKNPKNALIEINNLLVLRDIKTITIDDIVNIADKYEIRNIHKKYKKDFINLYKSFLNEFLLDKKLSEEELSILKHLKLLFDFNDKIIARIHNEVTIDFYKKEVQNVLLDEKITIEEKEFLSKLQKDLQLSSMISEKIFNKSSEKLIQDFFNNITSDNRISQEEENNLKELMNILNVNLNNNIFTNSEYQKMKLFWRIENGDIPIIETNINLQKNEKCYFTTKCKWYELRTITKRIIYRGPSFRVKIIDGLYWRTGSLDVQRITEDIMQLIDSGILYLTNKRIIFIGNRSNKSINLNKILDFICYKNGCYFQKESGRSPFIEFNENIDLFAIIFGQCIKQNT